MSGLSALVSACASSLLAVYSISAILREILPDEITDVLLSRCIAENLASVGFLERFVARISLKTKSNFVQMQERRMHLRARNRGPSSRSTQLCLRSLQR